MSTKNKAAVVAAAASVAFAGLTMAQPHFPNQPEKTPAQLQQERQNQTTADLSDADQNAKNGWREEGNDLVDADTRERLRPAEHRPRPKLPKFPFPLK